MAHLPLPAQAGRLPSTIHISMIHRSPLLATFFAVAIGAAGAHAQWTQVSPSTVPAERANHAMTYDWNRQQTVMFSGFSRTTAVSGIGDTWVYDGNDWTEKFPVNAPSPRARCHMVYDIQRGVSVLYGGAGPASLATTTPPTTAQETWEWDGTDWTQVMTPINPGDRRSYSMAYDINRGRVVLHGGIQSGLGAESETWEYDGRNWMLTVISAPTGPRAGAAMCFHAGLGKTVLFGGINPFTGGFNDTWTYDGTTWTRLNISGPVPSPREDARMVYDVTRGVCVLHGGLLSVSPFTTILGDTWEFDGVRWTKVGDSVPTARVYPGMAWDMSRERLVTFGGMTSATRLTTTDETWEMSGYFIEFGAGCMGSNGVPHLSAATPPRVGSPLTLDFANLSTTSGLGAVVFGGSNTLWAGIPLPWSMEPLGYTGCSLNVSLDLILPLAVTPAGTTSFTWNIPGGQRFFGLTLFAQGVSVDPLANPGGLAWSNGGSATIGQ